MVPPPEAALDLAPDAQARAHGQGLLVRGVEAEEAQLAGVRCRRPPSPAAGGAGASWTSLAVTVASICTVSPSRALRSGVMRVSSS
jgi:hypothetical protein